jgi:hypothetical protein
VPISRRMMNVITVRGAGARPGAPDGHQHPHFLVVSTSLLHDFTPSTA